MKKLKNKRIFTKKLIIYTIMTKYEEDWEVKFVVVYILSYIWNRYFCFKHKYL